MSQNSQLTAKHCAGTPWKVAIVDDDPAIHHLVERLLRKFVFDGCGVQLLSAHSGQEGCQLIKNTPDVAALLLDVIMETEQAGLDVVRYVRENLHNHHVRILLHTGQSSQFPMMDVITTYDINDYLDKSTLNPHKLTTALTLALRGFRDLQTLSELSQFNQILERRVTERTEALLLANQELQKQRESLLLSQEIAQLGNWDWDLVQDRFVCSQEVKRIFGFEGVESLEKCSSFQQFLMGVHEEDREKLQVALQRTLKDNQPFQCEHRVARPDGGVQIVRQLGRLSRGDDGVAQRLVGTVHDITAIRCAEDQLAIATRIFGSAMEEAAEHLTLTTKVLENAIEGVMVTDIWGVIQSVNNAFGEISGYSREEAIG
ncbi:MAG: PAS domain-containing protein, partial [Magnetococcales bacterium]|nr:PAS domain-containing protein [Magnetococcales bacterium]